MSNTERPSELMIILQLQINSDEAITELTAYAAPKRAPNRLVHRVYRSVRLCKTIHLRFLQFCKYNFLKLRDKYRNITHYGQIVLNWAVVYNRHV